MNRYAYLAGAWLPDTIRKGVIETSLFAHQPDVLVFGMMSALLAAGTWLLQLRTWAGLFPYYSPIIGAIIGFAFVSVGTEAVDWNSVRCIVEGGS
ncbi:inorganic phosphate transporter [Vibrio chagasii]|nr:inorganic phosphate transporter [Vibrio chagasii]